MPPIANEVEEVCHADTIWREEIVDPQGLVFDHDALEHARLLELVEMLREHLVRYLVGDDLLELTVARTFIGLQAQVPNDKRLPLAAQNLCEDLREHA